MALLKPIETIKASLSAIPIKPGQIIYCTDTKETYLDNISSERIQLSDIIQLDTEAQRTSILAPLNNKIYLIKDTNKLYRYNNGWIKLSPDITFVDLESYQLQPITIKNNGVAQAPRTLASLVYMEDGSKLSDILNNIIANINSFSMVKNTVIVNTLTTTIDIGIPGFDKSKDFLFVFENSVYLEDNEDYTISAASDKINSVGSSWDGTEEEIVINFIVMKNINNMNITPTQSANIFNSVSQVQQDNANITHALMLNNLLLGSIVLDFNKIKSLYDNKLWTISQVRDAVAKNKITALQYKDITGQVY